MNCNTRLLALNLNGCRLSDSEKIYMLIQSCKQLEIDMYFICEENTKQITRNIEKMKYELKLLRRIVEIIIADTKSQNSTKIDTDYLLGGILNAVLGNIVSMIDKEKMIIGRLGKWMAIELYHNEKQVMIITIYRIPQSSSYGTCCTLTQYNKMNG